MEYHIECPDKDFDLILTEYKEIPLTQGKVALVDVEDYEWLMQWKWYANKANNLFYAIRGIWKNKKGIFLKMHREIMKTPKNKNIDHINGNSLDNRRCNLRICNHSQNGMNSKIYNNNTSGYKGVCWNKQNKKWEIFINIDKKRKRICLFNTKEEAALAYNEAAKKYYGEFARLNILKEEA